MDRWRECAAHRELLLFLAWRDLTVRYKQTAIGIAWALLQPILMVTIFYFVFGVWAGMAVDRTTYVLATLAAWLPWQLFSQSVYAAAQSLVQSQDMLRKVYFPRIYLPLAPMSVALADFSIAFIILSIGIAATQSTVSWIVVGLLPALLLTILTAVGAGLWLAALNVRFRDIQVVTPFLMQVIFFITPIVYPSSQIPAAWRWLYALNPLSTAVDGFRTSLLGAPGVTATAAAVSGLVTLALVASGLWLFWETEDSFVDVV